MALGVSGSASDAAAQGDLLADIRTYLARTGVAKSTFGALAAGDARLVGDLERGLAITAGRAMRIRGWMIDNPDGMPAPHRPRPKKQERTPRHVQRPPRLLDAAAPIGLDAKSAFERMAERGCEMLRDRIERYFERHSERLAALGYAMRPEQADAGARG